MTAPCKSQKLPVKTHYLHIKNHLEGRESIVTFESPCNASSKEIRKHGEKAALKRLEISFLNEQQAKQVEGKHTVLTLANGILLLFLTALVATVLYAWFSPGGVKRSLALGNTGTLIGILLTALSAYVQREVLQKWLIAIGLLLGALFCWLAMAADSPGGFW